MMDLLFATLGHLYTYLAHDPNDVCTLATTIQENVRKYYFQPCTVNFPPMDHLFATLGHLHTYLAHNPNDVSTLATTIQ